jgi:hypothetical protein
LRVGSLAIHRKSWLFALVFVLSVVPSCGRDDASLARDVTRAVDVFHEQLSAREYERIWDESHELLRSQGREGFIAVLKSLREQLGRFRSSQRAQWGVRDVVGVNAGTYVEARYDASFEMGTVSETFTWKIQDSRVMLAGFQVTDLRLAIDGPFELSSTIELDLLDPFAKRLAGDARAALAAECRPSSKKLGGFGRCRRVRAMTSGRVVGLDSSFSGLF